MSDVAGAKTATPVPAGLVEHRFDGISFFTFEDFDEHESVVHGIFSRRGGVSSAPYDSLNIGLQTDDRPEMIAENVRRIARALDLEPDGIHRPVLSHGDAVAVLEPASRSRAADAIVNADAVIFDRPSVSALMSPADCSVVMLFDAKHHAAGMVHAGWKGIVANLVGRTLEAMARAFGTDPSTVLVGVGPSVGPCHYRIKNPAQKQLLGWHRYLNDLPDGRTAIDLRSALRDQMLDLGLAADNLTCDDRCTACHLDTFFSHHVERRTGRTATIMGLRAR